MRLFVRTSPLCGLNASSPFGDLAFFIRMPLKPSVLVVTASQKVVGSAVVVDGPDVGAGLLGGRGDAGNEAGALAG